MLLDDDKTLVAGDDALPALASLFDSVAFRQLATAAFPDLASETLRPCYVRYKPGTSCLVAYADDSGPIVYARTHLPSASDKLQKIAARARETATLVTTAVHLAPDGVTALLRFPHDHELRSLPMLFAAETRPPLLEELAGPEWREGSITTLRYKPERRWVGRLTCPHDAASLVLRLFPRAAFPAINPKRRIFESRSPLVIAPRRLRAKAHYATVTEWIDGTVLAELGWATPDAASLARRVGVALGQLHGQAPKGLQTERPLAAHLAHLERCVEAIEVLDPSLGPSARHVFARVAATLSATPWSRAAIHGDFASDQIVITGDAIGIIDLDRATFSDPRIDLAAFQAAMTVDNTVTCPIREAWFEEMVHGYRAQRPEAALHDLDAFVAGQLLSVAAEPFRARHPAWRRLVADRLDEATRRLT